MNDRRGRPVDRSPPSPGSGLDTAAGWATGQPPDRGLDAQLSELLQPDVGGDLLARGQLVGLGLCGLKPIVPLPEQSQAGGHQGGRTQQVDS